MQTRRYLYVDPTALSLVETLRENTEGARANSSLIRPAAPQIGYMSRCGRGSGQINNRGDALALLSLPSSPRFGRSPVSGRSSYTLFHGGLPTALLTIPLRDAVWPLTFMLAHKAVPHGCCHLLFTTMCSTIPTSPALTPVSPHGAAGQQKQPPPPPRHASS